MRKIIWLLAAFYIFSGTAHAEIQQQYLSPTFIRKIDWMLLNYTLRQKGETVTDYFNFVDATYSESNDAIIVVLLTFT